MEFFYSFPPSSDSVDPKLKERSILFLALSTAFFNVSIEAADEGRVGREGREGVGIWGRETEGTLTLNLGVSGIGIWEIFRTHSQDVISELKTTEDWPWDT